MRLGADVKVRTPAIPSGIASKKPASAAEGNGTAIPWKTSYQDQMASPMVQLAAPAAISVQAIRRRPDDLRAATPRLIAATADATPSPMSSTAIVDVSPPTRKAVQMRKATAAMSASNAAKANRLHSLVRMPGQTDQPAAADVTSPSVRGDVSLGDLGSAGEVCQATEWEPYVNSTGASVNILNSIKSVAPG